MKRDAASKRWRGQETSGEALERKVFEPVMSKMARNVSRVDEELKAFIESVGRLRPGRRSAGRRKADAEFRDAKRVNATWFGSREAGKAGTECRPKPTGPATLRRWSARDSGGQRAWAFRLGSDRQRELEAATPLQTSGEAPIGRARQTLKLFHVGSL
jgi:hypothetical protein